jgi:uncharacterized membrane protein
MADPSDPTPADPAPASSPFFRQSVLLALVALSLAYLVTSVVWPYVGVQLPLGLLALLFTPGYAVGAIALGPRSRWPWSLTFALVVGWSVGVNVALGLVLLVLHLGLPAVVFAASASVFSLVGAWAGRRATVPSIAARARSEVVRATQMHRFRRSQRVAAYVLTALIVIVLALIAVLAVIVPHPTPGLAFSITGYDGTSANLPPHGAANQSLLIEAIVQNNATAQSFTLEVRAMTTNTTPPAYARVPWTNPIDLANATAASENLTLASAQTDTTNVFFAFGTPGNYTLEFLLENQRGAVVGSATWPVTIT